MEVLLIYTQDMLDEIKNIDYDLIHLGKKIKKYYGNKCR